MVVINIFIRIKKLLDKSLKKIFTTGYSGNRERERERKKSIKTTRKKPKRIPQLGMLGIAQDPEWLATHNERSELNLKHRFIK